MNIKPMRDGFILPTRSTELAGGYDIYMPTSGTVSARAPEGCMVPLGFSAAIPPNHVALLLPRSSSGCKGGLALNNTVGVIDADYRGEWMANLRVHNAHHFSWEAGERIVQFIIVPVWTPELTIVDSLDETTRLGGFGSTGK